MTATEQSNGAWHGGKGSTPRPISDFEKYRENWDRIFNKKPKPDTDLDPADYKSDEGC